MNIAKKIDQWLDVLNYWYEHVEEFGERYPDMKGMVEEFSKTIDDMYDVYRKYKDIKDDSKETKTIGTL